MADIHRQTILVSLGFIALAILATWPLVLHLGTHVIGPFLGDNLEYVWKMWWVKHAVLDLQQSPLVQPDVYYPYGYPLAYGEISPIHTYLGIPLTVLFGPIVAYNVFVLVSVVLSGLFTYVLVRDLTHSAGAGIVAGVFFAYCPYRMARIAGHLPLIDTQWFPALFVFVERFIRQRRWTSAALAGLCLAAAALSSWYYGLFLALLLPVYLLLRCRRHAVDLGVGDWLRGGLVSLVVIIGLVLPFLPPYLRVWQKGTASMPLEQTVFWSASLTDYLMPNPRHWWWGGWVQKHLVPFPEGIPYEFIVGWGLVPTILAVYGLRHSALSIRRTWAWWSLIALVLSLGPVLKAFGRVVAIPVPLSWSRLVNSSLDWLAKHSLASDVYGLGSAGRIAIPLPILPLRWAVPGLSAVRSWGRLAILATLGVSVLSGAGVAAFLQREVSRRSKSVYRRGELTATAVLVVAVLLELYTGPQALVAPGPRPVDQWLASLPQKVTLIQMPMEVALSGPQMFYTMYHQQRIASGYGTYLPILIQAEHPELWTFPSDKSLDTLSAWGEEGVELVLVDEADVPAGDSLWRDIAAQERLDTVQVVETIHVYRIR